MLFRSSESLWHRHCYIDAAMRIAIADWQGRISPVFDAAGHLLLVDAEQGREQTRSEHRIDQADPLSRARQVAQLGVEVLICGAISWPLEMALSSAGVRVVSQICGPVEEVLQAFAEGQLSQGAYLMPGCRGRRRRLRVRQRWGRSR